jgi:hypothetical protein
VHRRELAELGDLVGAIRLPNTAHRAAGTQAVTDLVAFRRRVPDEAPRTSQDWISTSTIELDGKTAEINSYFAEHPQHVCGRLRLARGLYRDDELTVTPAEEWHFVLRSAMRDLVRHARATGTQLSTVPPAEAQADTQLSPARTTRTVGEPSPFPECMISHGVGGDGAQDFVRTDNGRFGSHPVPAKPASGAG